MDGSTLVLLKVRSPQRFLICVSLPTLTLKDVVYTVNHVLPILVVGRFPLPLTFTFGSGTLRDRKRTGKSLGSASTVTGRGR